MGGRFFARRASTSYRSRQRAAGRDEHRRARAGVPAQETSTPKRLERRRPSGRVSLGSPKSTDARLQRRRSDSRAILPTHATTGCSPTFASVYSPSGSSSTVGTTEFDVRTEKVPRMLFVTYGGGHVSMIIPSLAPGPRGVGRAGRHGADDRGRTLRSSGGPVGFIDLRLRRRRSSASDRPSADRRGLRPSSRSTTPNLRVPRLVLPRS